MGDVASMIVLIIGAVIALYIYFLPTIIANKNDHHSSGAILALNLLLGWSFIGWVIALVWALNHAPAQVSVVPELHAPLAQNSGETRRCPYCAEPILLAAIKCKHCASDLLTDPRDFVQ